MEAELSYLLPHKEKWNDGEETGMGKTNETPVKRIFKGKYALLYLLLLLIIVFSLYSKVFLTVSNINVILSTQVPVGFMALGAICIVIVDEFDLSLGYLLGFIMMIGAIMAKAGYSVTIVILSMVVIGTIFGIVNGILSVIYGISSFISTLAVGIAANGLTLGISGGMVVAGNFPALLLSLGQDTIGGIGICVLLFILVSCMMQYILQYTRFGRSLYAVGGSERVAFITGVKTKRVKILAFALAGMFTGISAVISLGQTGSAYPDFGSELLMPAYAVVFLSYTAFKQGVYNIPGLVLATVLFGVGQNALSILGAPFWAETIYNGTILLVSMLASYIIKYAQMRRLRDAC